MNSRFLVLIPLSAALFCCRSAPVEPNQQPGLVLPLHIAIAPITILPGATEPGREPKLQVDENAATTALERRLVKAGFSNVTVLKRTDLGPKASQPPTEVDWAELSHRKNADLLLLATLEYQPNFDSSLNWSFAWNLPVFLFAGPFNYLGRDRTYRTEGGLTAEIYATEKLRALFMQGAIQEDKSKALLVFSPSTFSQPMTFNFYERGGLTSWSLPVSLVWPSGGLATETKDVRCKIAERVVEDLVSDLTENIRRREADLLGKNKVYDFWYEAEKTGRTQETSYSLLRQPGGDIQLKGTVMIQKRSAGSETYMRKCRILDANQGTPLIPDLPFGDPREERREGIPVLVYEVDALVPRTGQDVKLLRLELIDGSPIPITRSYTLGVIDPSPSSSEG